MILDAELTKGGVFEADEMRRNVHRISKAVIYRTLRHLIDANIITQMLIDSKRAHDKVSFGRETRGHLVCVETKGVIKFDALELIGDWICRAHGLNPVSFCCVVDGM